MRGPPKQQCMTSSQQLAVMQQIKPSLQLDMMGFLGQIIHLLLKLVGFSEPSWFRRNGARLESMDFSIVAHACHTEPLINICLSLLLELPDRGRINEKMWLQLRRFVAARVPAQAALVILAMHHSFHNASSALDG